MNALADKFPKFVEIDGNLYAINTDYRVCLRVIMAFEDTRLTWREKQAIMLNLLYEDMPENISKACEQAIKFLNCGEESSSGSNDLENSERVYHFDKDAKYIYSAIKQSYNVDIKNIAYLHWWEFSYMFTDLSKESFFQQLIYYRTQINSGKLTKEEREYCEKIKDILELPEVVTAEELKLEDEFMSKLNRAAR